MSMFGNINIKEAPADVYPKCPHCKEKLTEILAKTEGTGLIGKDQILMCPHCQSFLGYGMYRR